MAIIEVAERIPWESLWRILKYPAALTAAILGYNYLEDPNTGAALFLAALSGFFMLMTGLITGDDEDSEEVAGAILRTAWACSKFMILLSFYSSALALVRFLAP